MTSASVVFTKGVRRPGEYVSRFTTAGRGAPVRLFLFVTGGTGSSVVFDNTSIRIIAPVAGQEGKSEG